MNKSNWKDTAELVGIAAIVASLIFVGLQLRQEHSIARSEVWSERNILRAELATLINENSDVWVRGLTGSELSESEKAQFGAMALLYIYKEETHASQRALGISPGDPELIAWQLVDMMATYPGLKAFWGNVFDYHRTRGTVSPFRERVDRLLTAVETGELEPFKIETYIPPE